MADISRLKRRNTLGVPPSMDEASQNLDAPEVAPAAPPQVVGRQHKAGTLQSVKEPAPEERPPRIDGRSLRKTDRTIPFASRVTPEFDVKLRRIAARDRLKLVEILEKALDAYEAQRKT
jgi:hypothetical protein